MMIRIAKPTMGREEKAAVWAVLESGNLAQGEMVRRFEEEFAAFCGTKHAIATSSGTAALHAALLAHGIGPGDEVITSPLTFIASANSILFTGARPVFVDIDEDSFNMDPGLAEAAITPRTKALLPVHLYGNPCDMEALTAIARRHYLAIIEDACQAHGAAINGQKVGSFGTGCFSFYATKNLTTAEGGMITTNDDQVAERARMLRHHGARQRYYHEILGYNYRMTELQAALGRVQLRRLPEGTEKRIANADYLTRQQRHTQITLPQVRPGYTHVFHLYTVRLPAEKRDGALEKLRAAGIEAGVYYPLPVHQQPLYRKLGYDQALPKSERASREILSLPVHPALTKGELDAIVREMNAL